MRQFILTIDVRSQYNNMKFIHHECIEADSLVELYSKLLIETGKIYQSLKDDDSIHRNLKDEDDDIPF